MLISLFFVILQVLIYIALAMDERLDKVKVQCDYLPLINFAMQQNGASIIHQISIENTTHAPLKDVQVQITTEPAFGNAVPTVIEAIPANDRVLSANFQSHLVHQLFHPTDRKIIRQPESRNHVRNESYILANVSD